MLYSCYNMKKKARRLELGWSNREHKHGVESGSAIKVVPKWSDDGSQMGCMWQIWFTSDTVVFSLSIWLNCDALLPKWSLWHECQSLCSTKLLVSERWMADKKGLIYLRTEGILSGRVAAQHVWDPIFDAQHCRNKTKPTNDKISAVIVLAHVWKKRFTTLLPFGLGYDCQLF
jgi:hypothetical protein